jgi:hypothetical protein
MKTIDAIRERMYELKPNFTQMDFHGMGYTNNQISLALHTLCYRRNEIILTGVIISGKKHPYNTYALNPDIPKKEVKTEREIPQLKGLPLVLGIRPESIPIKAVRVHRLR